MRTDNTEACQTHLYPPSPTGHATRLRPALDLLLVPYARPVHVDGHAGRHGQERAGLHGHVEGRLGGMRVPRGHGDGHADAKADGHAEHLARRMQARDGQHRVVLVWVRRALSRVDTVVGGPGGRRWWLWRRLLRWTGAGLWWAAYEGREVAPRPSLWRRCLSRGDVVLWLLGARLLSWRLWLWERRRRRWWR